MPTTSDTLKQELFELEHRFWKALQDGDAETAMSLTDETCIVTGAQGVGAMDRGTLGAMMKNATYKLLAFRLEQPEMRQLGDDVAVLAYKVYEELTVDGKPVAFDAADASTWIRRGGRWLCALHTESILGDPYGRDRRAQA